MANTATSFYIPSGNSNYVELGFNATTLGSSWTIEFWGRSLSGTVMSSYDCSAGHGFYAYIQNDDWYFNMGGTAGSINGGFVSTATWNHYAACRTGDTVTTFRNGIVMGSHYNSSFSVLGGATVRLGRNGTDGGDGTGYFDAVRISEVARYGIFDTPTTLVNTWQLAGRGKNTLLPHHTRLLIQSNSTMTLTDSIIDRSGYNTISATSVTVSRENTKFGNTAFLFGSGDAYLSYASNGSDHIGTQDFSYEQWIYPTSLAAWCTYYVQNGPGSSSTKGLLIGSTSDSIIGLECNNHDDGTYKPHAPGIKANVWTHVVHARCGSYFHAWVNGVITDSTSTHGTTDINKAQGKAQIGHGDSGFTGDFDGYMDGIRLCVGQSAYTPNFTPYGGLKNLAVNKGGAVTDAKQPSANTHVLQMGQAITSTNANTYNLNFDGTTAYMFNNDPDWRSSDSQGTIFAWVYIDSASSDNTIFSSGGGNVITNGDFSTGAEGWTGAGYETYASVSGGQSGNCLSVTRTADSYQYVHQFFPTVSGVAYTFSAYVKTMSGDDVGYIMYVGTGPGNNSLSGSNAGTASSSWVQVTDTFTATGSYAVISLVRGASTAAGAMGWDTVRCIQQMKDDSKF